MKTLGRLLAASTLLLGLTVAQAQAAPVVLSDGNSTASIDPNSQAGMYAWTVNGVDSMFQQWFWYRVGATGPEASIDTLGLISSSSTGRFADLEYGNAAGLNIEITYVLTGGNAGVQNSDIAETINIRNNGNTALDMHFFQYSDFDLCGQIGGQTATFVNANTVQQTGAPCILNETVVTPAANEHEAGTFATTLNSLNNGTPTTLNGTNSATGDATWAFEWDVNIAAGGNFIISKDKNLAPVPEPASLLLLGTGLLGLGGAARRRFFGNKA